MSTLLGDTAQRISRSASIRLKAPVETVFPLFGPVEEMKWAPGWSPEILYGGSDVQERLMFRTPGRYPDEEYYTWTIIRYSLSDHFVEYLVSSKNRIWFITVRCEPFDEETEAEVSYCYTGFDERAVTRNAESLDNMFAQDLRDWEKHINDFIKERT
jgi:hypothetical protein